METVRTVKTVRTIGIVGTFSYMTMFLSIFTKPITYIAAGLTYLYASAIRDTVSRLASRMADVFRIQMVIDNKQIQCRHAIKRFLLDEEMITSNVVAKDGVGNVDIEAPSGIYWHWDDNCGYIVISLQDEEIRICAMKDELTSYWLLRGYAHSGATLEKLRDWVNSLMNKYCSPTKSMRFFYVNYNPNIGSHWRFQTSRPLIDLDKLAERANSDPVKEFQALLREFRNAKPTYDEEKIPYRYGFLLHGPKGTYKSCMVKYAATKYHMPVYNLNLSSEGLTDNSLEILVSKIPPNSILAIDEVGKQLEYIAPHNKNSKITKSGIFKMLAGIVDMSSGIVVILTSNSNPAAINGMSDLIREGRIDKVIDFHTD